jgi:hypothetical protein
MSTATTPDARDRTRSTTRQTLLRLVGVLLGLAVTVSVTSAVTFTKVHDAARAVNDRTAVAITQLAIARAALVKADAAAISSLESGAAQLVGPGEEFQNQIAIASQSLTRMAETTMGDEERSSSLQFVEALLVTYAGLVGEATAHSGEEVASVAALWHASRLLHTEDQDSGILVKLDELIASHQESLHDEQSAGTTTSLGAAVLFAPDAALLVMLIVAQALWRRRFRRRINLWLIAATATLVALTAVSCLVFVPGSRLDSAVGELRTLVANVHKQAYLTDADAHHKLASMLDAACGNARCSDSVELFRHELGDVDTMGKELDDSLVTEEIRRVRDHTGAASANAGLVTLIYVLGAVLCAAILLGFRARLIEYRYRPR